MTALRFADRSYQRLWDALQMCAADIRAKEGAGAALAWFAGLAGESGDPTKTPIRRERVSAPGQIPPEFTVQINPARARRPRTGNASGNMSCARDLLDPEVIRAMSQGRQFGIELPRGSRDRGLVGYLQPFPLAATHFVIVAIDPHEKQDLHAGSDERHSTMVVADLADLAAELGPAWRIWFNGWGAGATQPRRHYHAIRPAPDDTDFPLEVASQALTLAAAGAPVVVPYPIATMRFRGSTAALAESGDDWLGRWLQVSDAASPNTANLIARALPPAAGEPQIVDLWFVPRRACRRSAIDLAEQPGCLEMLGEFVLATDEDLRRWHAGELSHSTLRQMLASVEPEGARAFLGAKFSAGHRGAAGGSSAR